MDITQAALDVEIAKFKNLALALKPGKLVARMELLTLVNALRRAAQCDTCIRIEQLERELERMGEAVRILNCAVDTSGYDE
jgi:hypothetical protein